MTVDDYYAISVLGDHKQLVDGAIVVHEPKPAHMWLQTRLVSALHIWTESGETRGQAGTPTDIRLDDYNVFGPDVLWFAAGHEPEDPYEYPDRVPDICVEIRSPGTWHHVLGKKRDAYERGGCPELWLVDDRARRVTVYRRSRPDAPRFDVELELAAGDELTSPQLPGFALPLERLFRDL
jgi:Uma2 family endonuclease